MKKKGRDISRAVSECLDSISLADSAVQTPKLTQSTRGLDETFFTDFLLGVLTATDSSDRITQNSLQ